ncbi:hypothetical protein L3Q82_010634 [Scortum barcoo]|uniref:Uncharacterized protein n=1 Tax=Scortum barcoo TaxID=214431 RepID=A0ACB8WCR2_9TELE|nr:hypothetical protein L3Q82_010634 [Scortum barcoo]
MLPLSNHCPLSPFLSLLVPDAEREWRGPFYFIQAADPQLGLMKAWKEGDCDGGGDEWAEEVELTKQAVEAVNQLRPRPRFIGAVRRPGPRHASSTRAADKIRCLAKEHTDGLKRDTPFREGQERDLKAALKGTDPAIPLVFVSGNHDLGNTPTPRTVEQYCSAWGNDYFSFWVGGVICLVLNSQLFYDASACPQLKEAQETWLEEQLSRASSTEPKPKHILVFQHIPLYLKSPDEEDDYFNLQRVVRQNLLDRFKKAGHIFSQGEFLLADNGPRGESRLLRPLSPKRRRLPRRRLDMVIVSSAIGCQLGEDTHGVRVVVVTTDGVTHRYHSLEQLRARGMDEDLRKLL